MKATKHYKRIEDDVIIPFETPRKSPGKCIPVPIAIMPGKKWQVRENTQQPSVNIRDAILEVPLGASDRDAGARLHELLHVLLSPADRRSLRIPAEVQEKLSFLEDLRVSAFMEPGRLMAYCGLKMRRMKWSTTPRAFQYTEIGKIIQRMQSIPGAVLNPTVNARYDETRTLFSVPFAPVGHHMHSLVATGIGGVKFLRDGARFQSGVLHVLNEYMERAQRWPDRFPLDPMIVNSYVRTRAIEEFNNSVSQDWFKAEEFLKMWPLAFNGLLPLFFRNQECTLQYVRELVKSSESILVLPTFENCLKEAKRLVKIENKLVEMAHEMAGMKAKPGQNTVQGEVRKKAEELYKRGVPRLVDGGEKSLKEALAGVKLRFKGAPLEKYKPYLLARKKRPEYVGGVPKHIEQLPFDGKVFEIKRRGRGGTVLVDVSGSMSLDQEELEKIVMGAPAVKVAVYSGDASGATGFRNGGQLTIVALGGRMATGQELVKAKHEGGQYNVVDIPALEWLANQEHPRIWVSDGGITGAGHRTYPIINKTASRMLIQHNILQVESVEKALKLFGRNIRMVEGKLVEDAEAEA